MCDREYSFFTQFGLQLLPDNQILLERDSRCAFFCYRDILETTDFSSPSPSPVVWDKRIKGGPSIYSVAFLCNKSIRQLIYHDDDRTGDETLRWRIIDSKVGHGSNLARYIPLGNVPILRMTFQPLVLGYRHAVFKKSPDVTLISYSWAYEEGLEHEDIIIKTLKYPKANDDYIVMDEGSGRIIFCKYDRRSVVIDLALIH